ncbi:MULTISPECIES: response regulator transcription factor [Shewanella]|jgi:two-component system OmpR family response regulator|uniref:Winged helix family two component transcriptional regulator n=1 Tax=Shewanella fodinae TaxID=552357 RepID=A0A4R2FFX4_9GAMM|nr:MULTISPECIES: response regulator transcription factor [Shewanella]MDN5369880.1 two-component system, OmpR family, response regulator [Shewanella sp.]MBO1272529.1 response regulator transcription factor [Shewanella sp. 4t3-1-2LB]MCL2906725.1 response regulator transcription factor [Shewanella fodinae]TCN84273.1 winged helix family two component transcriptional regulator [Shewanella fodinae]GGZ02877.1 DNA-binding response regulator [Shewanella fodinae]
MKILLVEDDATTQEYIVKGFLEQGHSIETAADGQQGLMLATTGQFELLILDRMLPGLDGLKLLAALRATGDQTPVLILSALSHVDERVKGLRAGGDDYMTKPFAFSELLVRAEKLMQRGQSQPAKTDLRVGPLRMELLTRTVTLNEEELLLQPKEFLLLKYLMEHANQVVSRTLLFEAVWDYHFDPRTNVIDVHIAKLRRKFEDLGHGELIETIRGAGYRLRKGY